MAESVPRIVGVVVIDSWLSLFLLDSESWFGYGVLEGFLLVSVVISMPN